MKRKIKTMDAVLVTLAVFLLVPGNGRQPGHLMHLGFCGGRGGGWWHGGDTDDKRPAEGTQV